MDGRDLFGAIVRVMGFAAALYPVATFGTIVASLSLTTLGPGRFVIGDPDGSAGRHAAASARRLRSALLGRKHRNVHLSQSPAATIISG